MNDRELLELAAKAAEKRIIDWVLDGNSVPVAVLDDGSRWQPLLENQFTDCMGDALRLAVKLRIDVTFNETDLFAFPPDGSLGESESMNANDLYAATRRAIVRAAAEIGKAMP